MSASERFLKSKRLVPVFAFANGGETALAKMEIAGRGQNTVLDLHETPLLLRKGERLVLEQDRSRLTMYRAVR